MSKIDGKSMVTSLNANVNRSIPLNKIRTKIIKYNGVDRMDQLADKHLGSPKYWWVITKINGLYANFWRLQKGSLLLIPEDVNEVLDYF